MLEIAIHEVQAKHIEQAILGEELVFVKDGQKYSVTLTNKTQVEHKVPKFGIAKGQIWMSDDFDEPLECFKEYMPSSRRPI